MDSEIRAGFYRQRRCLIAASLGLLLLQSVGLTLDKISIFGNEFLIQRTELLSVALWVTYFYFLIRYYQHFHDLGDTGINTMYNIRVNTGIGDWAYKKIKRDFLNSQDPDKNKKYIFRKYESKKALIDKRAAMIDISVSGEIITEKDRNISRSGFDINKTEYANWWIVYRIRIQAVGHIFIRTRLVTEYYLPFIVAAGPLLWWLLNIRTG